MLGLLVSSVLGTAPEQDTEAVDMREVAGAANMMGISLETVNKTRYMEIILDLETKDFTITEKAPTRAFSWLKAHTNAVTFKTL